MMIIYRISCVFSEPSVHQVNVYRGAGQRVCLICNHKYRPLVTTKENAELGFTLLEANSTFLYSLLTQRNGGVQTIHGHLPLWIHPCSRDSLFRTFRETTARRIPEPVLGSPTSSAPPPCASHQCGDSGSSLGGRGGAG